MKVKLFIGSEKIKDIDLQQSPIKNHETGLVLYMRRCNKVYLKNGFGKKVIELNSMPEDIKNIKYGEKVDIEWS